MSRESINHALGATCTQPWLWLVCIAHEVVTEFVGKAEPPATWLSPTVNNRDPEVPNLDIRCVTSIGSERKREGQEAQSLAARLQIEHRAVWLPGFDSYVAREILGVIEALRNVMGRTSRIAQYLAIG